MTTGAHSRKQFRVTPTELADVSGRRGAPEIKVTLDHLPFGSQFPVYIWVSPAQGSRFLVGQAVDVILQRRNIRTPKEGVYSGDMDWHWQWDLVDFIGEDDVSVTGPSDDGPPPGPDPMGESPTVMGGAAVHRAHIAPAPHRLEDPYDARERVKRLSIERQVALKAAVELLGPTTTADAETVVATAIAFGLYLATGEPVVPVQEPDEEEPTEEPLDPDGSV